MLLSAFARDILLITVILVEKNYFVVLKLDWSLIALMTLDRSKTITVRIYVQNELSVVV